jgi:1,4-dihydroxy-2-naphthoate octaprenyltransferase
MRKLFIILAFVCIVLGIILTILPTEKLALIPIFAAIIFGILAVLKSEINQNKLPKTIVFLALIVLIVAIGKTFLTKDEVVVDKKDEIQKIESQKEDKKVLEELDGL